MCLNIIILFFQYYSIALSAYYFIFSVINLLLVRLIQLLGNNCCPYRSFVWELTSLHLIVATSTAPITADLKPLFSK